MPPGSLFLSPRRPWLPSLQAPLPQEPPNGWLRSGLHPLLASEGQRRTLKVTCDAHPWLSTGVQSAVKRQRDSAAPQGSSGPGTRGADRRMVTWTPAAESCRLGGQGPPRRHPPSPPHTHTHAHTPVHQRRRRSASGTPATRRRPCAAPPRSAGTAAARCCRRPRCRRRASWSPACGEKAFNKEKAPKVWAAPEGSSCVSPAPT